MCNVRRREPLMLPSGSLWVLVFGVWCLVFGVRCSVFGVRGSVFGVRLGRSGRVVLCWVRCLLVGCGLCVVLCSLYKVNMNYRFMHVQQHNGEAKGYQSGPSFGPHWSAIFRNSTSSESTNKIRATLEQSPKLMRSG